MDSSDTERTMVPADQLTLTLERGTWQLRISGKVHSDAVALAMLRQAVDVYEIRVKTAMHSEMQEALVDQQYAQSILSKGVGRS